MHRVGDNHPLLHPIFNQLLSSIALAVEHLQYADPEKIIPPTGYKLVKEE